MILFDYHLFEDVVPNDPGRYLIWKEDGKCSVASWDGERWLTLSVTHNNDVVYWAYIPTLNALDVNYGKSL